MIFFCNFRNHYPGSADKIMLINSKNIIFRNSHTQVLNLTKKITQLFSSPSNFRIGAECVEANYEPTDTSNSESVQYKQAAVARGAAQDCRQE